MIAFSCSREQSSFAGDSTRRVAFREEVGMRRRRRRRGQIAVRVALFVSMLPCIAGAADPVVGAEDAARFEEGFFEVHEEAIGGITSILGVGSIFLAAVGLYRNSLETRARTIYEIQKDARTQMNSVVDEPDLCEALFGERPGPEEKRGTQIGAIINFYAAVFQQYDLGVLDDDLWTPIERDFAAFLRSDQVRGHWDQVSFYYPTCFRALVQRLLEQRTP